MKYLSRRTAAGLVLALALPACDAAPEIGVATAFLEDEECGILGCGGNHPQVANHPLSPIRTTSGVVSESGFATGGMVLDGALWRIEVHGGELYAVTSTESRRGDEVEGGYIRVQRGPAWYKLHILEHVTFEYWTRPGESVHAYRLEWEPLGGGGKEEVCVHPPLEEDPEWGPYRHYAFLVAGERYDIPSISVVETGGGAADVVNVACAGSALAKAEMNSYSPNIPAGDDWATQPWERELVLRAYAGAYCYDDTTGPGDTLGRYTVPGEPLKMEDSKPWMTPDVLFVDRVEAVWSQHGVVCLQRPRRLTEEPDILLDVEAECELPPTCLSIGLGGAWNPSWTAFGLIRTVVPAGT